MTPIPPDPAESPALTALTELYRADTEAPSTAEIERGLDSLLTRVESARSRRRRVGWSLAVAASLALCAAVALRVTSARTQASALSVLSYQVDGGRVIEGGYLRESGNAGMNVAFNEGSQIELSPGTRGRIREVAKEGAHVVIERGTATFKVTPGTGRRWSIDVGPFLVTVKGTVFTLSWDPVSEEFRLSLQRGRVVVSGPASAGEIELRAGQRVAVNLAKSETIITEDNPADAKAALSAQPPAASPAPSSVGGQAPEVPPAHASSAKGRGERRWSEELANGRWDRILDDVKRVGVEATLAEASSEDLFAVASAARYRHQPELARSALLALRRRFPNSPRALDAIFLLGRLEEARSGGSTQAVARYDEYLARAPHGAFAGEALGRKMTLTDALEGPARARVLAEEYLRRFPSGSYAGSARALMRAP